MLLNYKNEVAILYNGGCRNTCFETKRSGGKEERFTDRVFLKHKSKMIVDCCVFKFFRRSVDGKLLMRFQSESSVFKLFRRSVDGALPIHADEE